LAKIKTADIRKSFLDYFQKHDHRLVPSSPVIPFEDPTILFINAGMNQFKDIFTGKRKPEAPRATSTQKCIRAGGKHNDLDNVGFTARHHTFFEMLGNFSFGDYFKEEAIAYAWEWVTRDLGLPKDRLYASVYEEDDEAFELWEKIAPELKNGRVMRFGKKDNYWAMGDVGPCGPSSEIHFDRGEKYGTGPNDVVNGETDRFVEFWNLVFMQYERSADGTITPLPKTSVDTGAGLERIAAIMQNVDSNYGIDIFKNLIAAVSDLTGTRYADNISSHHVVADHVRALTFALADGAGISNEGRGYVLRRILRRAARHGRELGANEPFIHKLVPVLVNEMGNAYPEIREKQQHVMNVIKSEEESFCCTLDTGCEKVFTIAYNLAFPDKKGKTLAFLGPHTSQVRNREWSIHKELKGKGYTINGETAFGLYDTCGFPLDLIQIEAAKYGLSVDVEGFEERMRQQQERSRAGGKFESKARLITKILDGENIQYPATEFVRGTLSTECEVQDTYRSQKVSGEEIPHVFVVLNQTPFYVEAGGQTSDTGVITTNGARLDVMSVHLHNDVYLHEGALVSGELNDLKEGTKVTATVDADRRLDIMRNHTATHLAHAALRKVLGKHVKQSGSYVGPDRLRFDFSHHQPMTPDEIAEVERIVNEQILGAWEVVTRELTVDKAKAKGAMALFGEKYGDVVWTVFIGEDEHEFSIELCGGTHVNNTSQIGPFFVTLETGIASGVRRMEAITGREAQKQMLENKEFRRRASLLVNRTESEALAGIEQLKETASSLQKELKKAKTELVAGGGQTVGTEIKVAGISLWTHGFDETDRDSMSAWIDSRKDQNVPVVALTMGTTGEKVTVMLAASATAIKSHGIHAGKLAKDLLAKFDGRGGGKPNFAQGGVPIGTDAQQLFDEAEKMLSEKQG